MNVLFVCSQNKLRSPTAEQTCPDWPGVEVDSAGLNNDAENPVTPENVAWADLIFVMEKAHRSKLTKQFRKALRAKVICLDIPDDYGFMDEVLVRILQARVPRFFAVRPEAVRRNELIPRVELDERTPAKGGSRIPRRAHVVAEAVEYCSKLWSYVHSLPV